MKRLLMLGAVSASLVCLSSPALADWFEDFDSYANGSQLVGQGEWEAWSPGSGALVSNAQSRTPAMAADINGATDLVHQYYGYTSGTWQYKAYQYIPGTMTGTTYFIMLNTYNAPSGPYDWSVQVAFNSSTGNVEANVGSGTAITMPYIPDQWVEVKVVIYLDDDWAQFFYNGQLIDDPAVPDHPTLGGGYTWTGGVFGGGSGALNIGAVDLFANNATSAYYDDISLTPVPSWFENFEPYAAGSQMVGQGGWSEWGPGAGALCSNAQARSGNKSVDINGATDLVHEYSGYTSGTWEYKAYQYIPGTMTGTTYFIMLNTYNYPSGPYDWSVQVAFNSSTGNVEANVGSGTAITMPYIPDQWVEIKVVIHLDDDWAQFFYNGTLIDDPAVADHPTLGGGYQWTGGVFGGGSGALNIGALDLYANNATSAYYDDLSLVALRGLQGSSDRLHVGAGAGGNLNFALNATTAQANSLYLMFGSMTGTSPGLPLPGGLTLPLVFDGLSDLILLMPNSALFQNFTGLLDGDGMGSATLAMPAVPQLAGFSMYFAFLTIPIDYVSNPVEVKLLN